MTLDGKISSKSRDSFWISNEHSRNIGHNLRSQTDAVLIGVNTLLTENPKLNARNAPFMAANVKSINKNEYQNSY